MQGCAETPAEAIFESLPDHRSGGGGFFVPIPTLRYTPPEGFSLGVAEIADENFGIDAMQRELDTLKDEINARAAAMRR